MPNFNSSRELVQELRRKLAKIIPIFQKFQPKITVINGRIISCLALPLFLLLLRKKYYPLLSTIHQYLLKTSSFISIGGTKENGIVWRKTMKSKEKTTFQVLGLQKRRWFSGLSTNIYETFSIDFFCLKMTFNYPVHPQKRFHTLSHFYYTKI